MRYEELNVYKDSHRFVLDIYSITKRFPNEENFSLIDQMIRAAYSIPSNIAEGNNRNTTKEYINFLYIARGSANEVKYFLLLSKDLNYIEINIYDELKIKIENIIKMLNGLVNSLKGKQNANH